MVANEGFEKLKVIVRNLGLPCPNIKLHKLNFQFVLSKILKRISS